MWLGSFGLVGFMDYQNLLSIAENGVLQMSRMSRNVALFWGCDKCDIRARGLELG
jgi:hypothetical protein